MLIVIVIIGIYALRSFYFDIPFWPVCPLKPKTEGRFKAGKQIENTYETRSDSIQHFSPLERIRFVTV